MALSFSWSSSLALDSSALASSKLALIFATSSSATSELAAPFLPLAPPGSGTALQRWALASSSAWLTALATGPMGRPRVMVLARLPARGSSAVGCSSWVSQACQSWLASLSSFSASLRFRSVSCLHSLWRQERTFCQCSDRRDSSPMARRCHSSLRLCSVVCWNSRRMSSRTGRGLASRIGTGPPFFTFFAVSATLFCSSSASFSSSSSSISPHTFSMFSDWSLFSESTSRRSIPARLAAPTVRPAICFEWDLARIMSCSRMTSKAEQNSGRSSS
mmetsp:Transcript_47547/g.134217  ORF Transcript_47547/g.134217 Transcript_47547/m.134217 type:complete len:275 (-) Transcript_47547:502-1326(-)